MVQDAARRRPHLDRGQPAILLEPERDDEAAKEGELAVVEGVGYPGPNRSHFASFDIWHAADTRGRLAGTGWMTRLAAAIQGERAHEVTTAVHVGDRMPYSLYSATHPSACFRDPSMYQWERYGGAISAGIAMKGALAVLLVVLSLQESASTPLSVETRCLRLEWLIRSRRLDEAHVLAEQLVVLFPASPRAQLLAGDLGFRRRDYASAERHLRESDALAPASWTRQLLAKTLSQLGRDRDAEALLLELVEERPKARLDLAWIYERRGETARALAEVGRVLRAFPDDAWAKRQKLRLEAELPARTFGTLGDEFSSRAR